MSKMPSSSDEKNSSPVSTGALLALTFLDTTWRMAVPSVGFTLLGLWLDQTFGTAPWLMVAGAVVGFVSAFYLVYQQIKRSDKYKS